MRGAVPFRQVVVPRRDARVDDRDADPGAGVAERLVNRRRSHRHRGAVVVRAGRTVLVDAEDGRVRFEARDDAVREGEHVSVDDVELPVRANCLNSWGNVAPGTSVTMTWLI